MPLSLTLSAQGRGDLKERLPSDPSADGHLYCYGERNEVTLVEVNPEEYIEKGRFSVPKGSKPAWAHPVVANGRFYLRDMTNLTCYNVRAD
jgi:hypothetical protein